MFKVVIATALALGLGVATVTTGNAAALAPTAGVRAALAPIDTVELAQFVDKRVRVGPRGGAVGPTTVVGPRGAVGRTTVVGPRGAVGRTTVVGPRGAVGRATVVGPRGGFVGGRTVVGRPAYVRSYRPWSRRPYFGTILGGIALGSILTVAAVGVAPAYAPAPDTCWYWADPSMTRGYWDYCD
jgi:hypothetical protein